MNKMYFIGYDLNSPGQKYSELTDIIIKNFGSRAKPLESTWLVITNKTAEQIYKLLVSVLDKNDRILIMETNPENRAGYLDKEIIDWLK